MEYQIVADESVDFRIVLQLRKIGLDVFSIIESTPSVNDIEVLSIAFQNKALLVTEDKDFGELIFRLRMEHCGVLLVRIIENDIKINTVVETIKNNFEELKNNFSVIKNETIRIVKIKR